MTALCYDIFVLYISKRFILKALIQHPLLLQSTLWNWANFFSPLWPADKCQQFKKFKTELNVNRNPEQWLYKLNHNKCRHKVLSISLRVLYSKEYWYLVFFCRFPFTPSAFLNWLLANTSCPGFCTPWLHTSSISVKLTNANRWRLDFLLHTQSIFRCLSRRVATPSFTEHFLL